MMASRPASTPHSQSLKTQTANHAVHVARKAAFLWLASHRKRFGNHIPRRLAKSQAFRALGPLAGARRLALQAKPDVALNVLSSGSTLPRSGGHRRIGSWSLTGWAGEGSNQDRGSRATWLHESAVAGSSFGAKTITCLLRPFVRDAPASCVFQTNTPARKHAALSAE